MLNFKPVAIAVVAAAFWASPIGDATAQTTRGSNCITKAGQGTNTTEEGAKFQAYEAILQAIDWGMWSNWMSTSQKIGVAPGYRVTRLRSKCEKGTGFGYTCVLQASLCK